MLMSTRYSRYLTRASQLEETIDPRILKTTILVISIAIVGFMLWAGFTNINEVARAEGEVVTQGKSQTVQHLEGGVLSSILVSEGERVEKGQALLVMQGQGAESDLARFQRRLSNIRVEMERLRATLENREPDWTSLTGVDPAILADQQALYQSERRSFQQEISILQEQIRQKERMLILLASELKLAEDNLTISKELSSRQEELKQQGYSTDVELLNAAQQVTIAEGNVRRISNQISVTEAELQEFRGRLASLRAKKETEDTKALADLQDEFVTVRDAASKLSERVNRLTLTAPTTGIVSELNVNTIGAVVQPGQVLLTVVPEEDELEVELQMPPRHLGRVQLDQTVFLKVTSFDFSRFGSVEGKVTKISPTSFVSESGRRYFQVTVVPEKTYVGDNPANRLSSGMTVNADIITGEKTLLEYLFKPIHYALNTAFSER